MFQLPRDYNASNENLIKRHFPEFFKHYHIDFISKFCPLYLDISFLVFQIYLLDVHFDGLIQR